MTSYTLIVPGEPTGKGRPRFSRASGRAITPAATRFAENRVYLSWFEAGQPRIADGPIAIDVEAVLTRPRGHYRQDGSLNPAGQRSVFPTKTPDVDNLLKLVADALNGNGYRDDAQIVYAAVIKRWAKPDEPAHTHIVVESWGGHPALTEEVAA